MRVPIMCETCKTTPHVDHFECDKCHNHIHGGTTCGGCRDKIDIWIFCPFCGERLEKSEGEIIHEVSNM